MELDKFVKCSCGKKKKINWIHEADFKKGKVSFCVGLTLCQKCLKEQQHYSGNIEDIQRFINYVESQTI